MKKLIYILSMFTLLITGCQTDETVTESTPQEKERRTISFSMDVPDFQVVSRAVESSISKIDLLVFDADKKFIEKVEAENINGIKKEGQTPAGTFKASVSPNVGIIHFIANYNGSYTNLNKGTLEDAIIPALQADCTNMVYWAKNEIEDNATSVHVSFLRHLAKVTYEVSDENIDGYAASSYFKVTGLTICNYVSTGTVAPSNYTWNMDGTATEITGVTNNASGTAETLTDEAYLAEFNNQVSVNSQVFVILAGQLKPKNTNETWNTNGDWGAVKYYKVLLTDTGDNPYQIIRNVNYKIVVKQMQDVGAETFEAAKTANPINNLYAYVMPESPSISDMGGNTLTVTPLVHLLLTDGANTATSSITMSDASDEDLEVSVYSDPDRILSGTPTYANGKVTATVNFTKVTTVRKAEIRVKWGKLSRTVTVIASPKFMITADAYSDKDCTTTKTSYSASDEDVYFKFTLDASFPSDDDYPDLYPIKCYIHADNLYPADNKDMLIDYEYKTGQYWYTYLATTTGDHIIHFKTKLSSIGETITVESPYFSSAAVSLSSTK